MHAYTGEINIMLALAVFTFTRLELGCSNP